ncbi:hypothetical protein GOP47_0023012 [Adiantum capillus-veneris]|uniref:Serine/threonine protein phosphatase 2A regulatory subunit n=1 Tax=Adiantum capillus-veneris TaxID=13818 RepID=A0A9D4U6N9_ADICA|nr:hypothetical protein GOP47_0023012 [Adiantum capillus-veneris]
MATTTITITTEILAWPMSCNASAARTSISTIKTTPPLRSLPLFSDVSLAERPNLFIAKLHLCSHVYDFRDPTSSLKEKHIKKRTLLELVDFISSDSMKITEFVVEEVIKMVAANLFRALPHNMRENFQAQSFDKEDEEPILEPAWPHLVVVYEFFLLFITSTATDAKIARLYINQSFILKLMDLFESEDSRERQYLKTILHRIYGKFMVYRSFVRQAVNNIFHHFVLETERHHGIAEFLEILGSIINGFAIPLKEEHINFLVRALIPLHKAKSLSTYHQQLCYCMTQYIAKDLRLVDTVVKSLLKYWPITNSHKEVSFLGELEEILEVTQPEIFEQCMVPLFRQVDRCLNSPHFQVAERALFLCNNSHIVNLIKPHRSVILPIIVPSLESNGSHYWNRMLVQRRRSQGNHSEGETD